MSDPEDCPDRKDYVSNELCDARMAGFKIYIEGVKSTIKTTGAAITLIVSIVAILSRFI